MVETRTKIMYLSDEILSWFGISHCIDRLFSFLLSNNNTEIPRTRTITWRYTAQLHHAVTESVTVIDSCRQILERMRANVCNVGHCQGIQKKCSFAFVVKWSKSGRVGVGWRYLIIDLLQIFCLYMQVNEFRKSVNIWRSCVNNNKSWRLAFLSSIRHIHAHCVGRANMKCKTLVFYSLTGLYRPI